VPGPVAAAAKPVPAPGLATAPGAYAERAGVVEAHAAAPGGGLAPGQELAPAPQACAGAPPVLGADEIRWALLRPPCEDAPRLGAALLEQRDSNPLFRVRYAHSRTRAALRNAHDLGVRVESGAGASGDPYRHPAETELLGLIADYPRVVETAARRRAPDRLARHLERLADAYLRFQDECPALPKGDEKPSAAHAARIRLADATGLVLAGGLGLLGISAPDHL
jgi:arginyl-tRNA synthetase